VEVENQGTNKQCCTTLLSDIEGLLSNPGQTIQPHRSVAFLPKYDYAGFCRKTSSM